VTADERSCVVPDRAPRPVIVGVGDCKIGRFIRLVTYALGSCIAVAIVEPELDIGCLLHLKLPDSGPYPELARESPFYFADLGVKYMLQAALELGLQKKRARVCLIGGAQMFDAPDLPVGKLNYLAAKKALWSEGMMVHKEAVGGDKSRSVFVSSGGSILVRTGRADEADLLGL